MAAVNWANVITLLGEWFFLHLCDAHDHYMHLFLSSLLLKVFTLVFFCSRQILPGKAPLQPRDFSTVNQCCQT